MSIKAVLFDLDNTLTNRSHSIYAYAKSLIHKYQQNLAPDQLSKILEITNRIDNGGYPKKEILTHQSIGASVAFALLQELTWNRQPNFEVLTRYWFEQFGNHAVAMEGAEELLHQLKQEKFKLAIVSNGGHSTRLAILDGLGFSQYFDVIISSETVGVSKPNAGIFLETSRQLGVRPEQCLFVGDHPINDIQGAQNVGMKAILMDGFHFTESYIEHRIKHLSELWNFL